MRLDIPADRRDEGLFQAVFFLADHLHHLLAPLQGGLEHLVGLVRQGPGFGPQGLGEVGQDLGIDLIGFGQLAGGAGEFPHRLGIDQGHRQLGLGQGRGHQELITAGGLQHDELGFEGRQALDQLLDAAVVVGGDKMAVLRPHGHIQVLLGDVEADKNLAVHSLLSRPCRCEIMVSGDCSG